MVQRGVGAQVPVASVVVPAYNSRARIDWALTSLRLQDLAEPYEVIVVDSGRDGCAEYVAAAYPEARVLRSRRRLFPGEARNAGVAAARGRYVAFLPDDGIAEPDWLRRRVERHREGFDAVGGAITNGTPFHAVGSAGYFLEYASLLPARRVLARQAIPHCLSFDRKVFHHVGPYPEGLETGEDTIFNERCLAAGIRIRLDERIRLAHRNLTGFRDYLRHQYRHGRGLVESGRRRPRAAAAAEARPIWFAYRWLLRYPVKRIWSSFVLVARGRPRSLPAWLALSPLIAAGAWAAAVGCWLEWSAARRSSRSALDARGASSR